MKPIRVLFVCRGNDCRSQMAEGFLRRYGKERFEVFSAGIEPEPIHELTLEVMARAAVDLSTHRAKAIQEFASQPFDFVVTVCDESRDACPSFASALRLIHWRFQDPAAVSGRVDERRRAYMRIRDEIAGRIRLFAYAQTRRQDTLARELSARELAAPGATLPDFAPSDVS